MCLDVVARFLLPPLGLWPGSARSPLSHLPISSCATVTWAAAVHTLHTASCWANLKENSLFRCPLLITEPVSQAAESIPGKIIREEASSREKGSFTEPHPFPPLVPVQATEFSHTHTHPGKQEQSGVTFPRETSISSLQMGTNDTPKK